MVSPKTARVLIPLALRRPLAFLLALLPAIVIATAMFAQGLFQDKTLYHGDALLHGLPVLSFQSSVLHGDTDMLWTDKLYMGHPVHAEGQFEFFSPLNVFVSLFFAPAKAANVLHWLSLILTAAGVIALGRALGLSYPASLLASLLVAFSGTWIHNQHNITIASALTWLPWVLWGYEKWIREPDNIAPLVLSVSISAVSGYPQLLHGAAIYLIVLFLHALLAPSLRPDMLQKMRRYVGYGVIAILICLGITAVQLLPLAELVTHSYRDSGIDIFLEPTLVTFFRGIPFYCPDSSLAYTQFFGSAAIFLLFSALLLVWCNTKLLGHALASLILASLAVGHFSPLTTFFYKYHLIPGLHSFRVMLPYLTLTIVGLAVVAGHVADRLARADIPRRRLVLTLLFLVPAGLVAVNSLHLDDISNYQYWLLTVEALLAIVILFTRWKRHIAILFVLFVIVEVTTLKLDNIHFFPNSILKEPDTVAFIKRDKSFADYKVHDESLVSAYTMQRFSSPTVGGVASVLLHYLTPSTNLLWDIPSTFGAHALPLQRRMLLQPTIKQEINTPSTGRAGLRLIDFYGIKYITSGEQPRGESIVLVNESNEATTRIYENQAAYPRYQTYTSWEIAGSPEEALEKLKALDAPRLIVEAENHQLPAAAPGAGEPGAITFSAQNSTPTDHQLSLHAKQDGWFFLADANYPGWRATVDGQDVPVFTAQGLGKAVWIPKGEHQLRIWFSSTSFNAGLAISIGTCVIAAIAYLIRRRRST